MPALKAKISALIVLIFSSIWVGPLFEIDSFINIGILMDYKLKFHFNIGRHH